MIAVIKTGGKQYVVEADQTVRIEKKMGEPGSELKFDEVLLVADDKAKIKAGDPFLKGATVTGEIMKQGRSRKVTVTKYKNKTRYKRTLGHRQYFTDVKIKAIKA